MSIENKRLAAAVQLGSIFKQYTACKKEQKPLSLDLEALDRVVNLAEHKNSWFTLDNVLFSLDQWGDLLEESSLMNWLSHYPKLNQKSKRILLILAGNIPLVGFHDFLVCYLSGNDCLIKTSSTDQVLLKYLIEFLLEKVPEDKNAIILTEEIVKEYDAVIATGSDNTARYFNHYFAHKPHIIRRNRNSIAVLNGEESTLELKQLGEDIFRYYGLGCRSVSKIYVPKEYNFDLLFNALFEYKDHIYLEKYANNYDYNKAVYLMSEFKILDNGFLILKEDESLSSPIGSLFYQTYESKEEILEIINQRKEAIQCVVSKDLLKEEVAFGSTQKPSLTDYADGVDTLKFVLSL